MNSNFYILIKYLTARRVLDLIPSAYSQLFDIKYFYRIQIVYTQRYGIKYSNLIQIVYS